MIKDIFHKFQFILSLISIYKKSATLLFVLMLLIAFSEVLGLSMIMPLLGAITGPGNESSGTISYLGPITRIFPEYYNLIIFGGLMACLILLKNIFVVIYAGYSSYFVFRLRKLWQCSIMKKYMYAEYSYILSQKQGTLLNNLLIEPGRAAKSLKQIIEFSSKSILALFLYGLLLLTNWYVTLGLTIISACVMILLRKITYNYAMGVGKKKVSISQELTCLGAENISAIRQIKIFLNEEDVCKRMRNKLDELLQILVRYNIISDLPNPMSESFIIVGLVSVLCYLQYVANISLTDSIPVIGIFVITSQRFVPIVSRLYAERMNILTLIPSLKLVNEIMNSLTNKEELDKGKTFSGLQKDIIFQNIHFSYPGTTPLFKGFNMEIAKGRMTAIVGPSGSGKSTIVDLLIGFFKPQRGEILINGHNLRDLSLRSLRNIIGYVSQDTFLFNTTVRDNILVGKPDASEDDIVSAARKANADQFIRKLPHGYDTVLGDRGLKISGGQRQRIAIARVIIRNPEVLIFDEATSSLDPEAERLIQESIDELARQRTVIVISHRLSTVKNADVIYVLENGRIVESGTFKELEKRKGRFYKMQIS